MTRPPETEIERQAAEWFARLRASTVSVSELEAFRTWKAAPAHQAAYERLERLWSDAAALRHDDGVRMALEAARSRPSQEATKVRRALLAAACVCAVIGSLAIWSASRSRVFATDPGERRVFQLADGSEVHLDVDSQLAVRLTRGDRNLTLERGRALFSVARDPTRPFRVLAGDTRIVATGTQFDVRRDEAGAQVTLIEGGVAVRRDTGAGARSWTLEPGQQLSAGLAAEPVPVRAEAVASWTRGRLEFDRTPLSQAVREVGRYDRRGVNLAPGVDPALAVTGVFNTGDAAAFAEAVASLYGLTASRTPGGGVVIAPPAEKKS